MVERSFSCPESEEGEMSQNFVLNLYTQVSSIKLRGSLDLGIW